MCLWREFAPSGVPAPSCVGCNAVLSVGVAWRSNVLAVILLKTVGTPSGRMLLFGFSFAVSVVVSMASRASFGRCPFAI